MALQPSVETRLAVRGPIARAALAAALLTIALPGAAATDAPTAPESPDGGVTDNTGEEPPARVDQTELIVHVALIEASGMEPAPAQSVPVHVVGQEESPLTEDDGAVRLMGVSSKKVDLEVMVPGLRICRLRDVTVPAKRIVRVVVDRSKKGRCELVK